MRFIDLSHTCPIVCGDSHSLSQIGRFLVLNPDLKSIAMIRQLGLNLCMLFADLGFLRSVLTPQLGSASAFDDLMRDRAGA